MSEINWKAFARIFDHFNTDEYNPILPMFCLWAVDRLDEREDDPVDIVEVGCGTGLVAARFHEWYAESRFLLNDNNTAMLEVARNRFRGQSRVRFDDAAGETFLRGLEPDGTDVVLFARSFYALTDHARVASDVIRALRRDGLVIVLDFTRPVDLEPLDAIFAEVERERWPICRTAYEEFNEGLESGRYRVFTREELDVLWQTAGGRLLGYQSNEPASGTHFLAIERAER